MQPFPQRLIEVGMIGMIVAAVIGLLILIAPNFGLKPKQTVDGWRFPVKPTCLLLYYLALGGGIVAVGFSAAQLLASGTSNWVAWLGFGFGFFLVPVVLADWPEPLILDGQGLLGGRSASSRIHWQELLHVRAPFGEVGTELRIFNGLSLPCRQVRRRQMKGRIRCQVSVDDIDAWMQLHLTGDNLGRQRAAR